jgi:hypothetical protein
LATEDHRVWPHLHGQQENHSQLGVDWSESGNDAIMSPELPVTHLLNDIQASQTAAHAM